MDQLGRCHPYGDAPSDPERNEIHREKDDQARIPAPLVFNEQSDEIRQYVTSCHQSQEPNDKSHLDFPLVRVAPDDCHGCWAQLRELR